MPLVQKFVLLLGGQLVDGECTHCDEGDINTSADVKNIAIARRFYVHPLLCHLGNFLRVRVSLQVAHHEVKLLADDISHNMNAGSHSICCDMVVVHWRIVDVYVSTGLSILLFFDRSHHPCPASLILKSDVGGVVHAPEFLLEASHRRTIRIDQCSFAMHGPRGTIDPEPRTTLQVLDAEKEKSEYKKFPY